MLRLLEQLWKRDPRSDAGADRDGSREGTDRTFQVGVTSLCAN
jgi:hypothetical protein